MLVTAFKRLATGTARYLRFDGAKTDTTAAVAVGTIGAASAQSGRNAGPLLLDLGCGSSKKPGFLGIDRRSFEGVDGITDLTRSRWVFDKPTLGGLDLVRAPSGQRGFVLPDNSVAEVHCSHFLEHLEHNQSKPERVRFMNELWRVMIPGGQALIITPHWASHRAYGDFTHADKPVAEMFYSYLDRYWRLPNAPDNDIKYNPDGYFCDFSADLGYSVHPAFAGKSVDEQNHAINWFKDAALELHARLVCRK